MKKKSFIGKTLEGIYKGLSPNLIGLVVFLVIAQVLFFVYGPRVIIQNISGFGLFLLNLVFAIIIPYNLALIIKAIKLIKREVER